MVPAGFLCVFVVLSMGGKFPPILTRERGKMSKNDYLKECWQAANEDWQTSPKGQKFGNGFEIFIKDLSLRHTDDRTAANVAKVLESSANLAIKSKYRNKSQIDYIAPMVAEYRKKAAKAEGAFNARIASLVADCQEVKEGLETIEKLDSQRAETLATLDKSSPNLNADLMVIEYHTRAAKTAIHKGLEAKIKELAGADEEADRLWQQYCSYRETAEKLAKQPHGVSGIALL